MKVAALGNGCIVDCCLLFVATSYLLIVIAGLGGRLFFVWMNPIAALTIMGPGVELAVTVLWRSSSEELRLGRVKEESKASPVIFVTGRDLIFSERKEWCSGPQETFCQPMCNSPIPAGIGEKRRNQIEMR